MISCTEPTSSLKLQQRHAALLHIHPRSSPFNPTSLISYAGVTIVTFTPTLPNAVPKLPQARSLQCNKEELDNDHRMTSPTVLPMIVRLPLQPHSKDAISIFAQF